MTDSDYEIYERMRSLETVTFGVDGSGGLMQEVKDLRIKVQDHETKINTISLKMLMMITTIGIVGDLLVKIALSYFANFPKLK